MEEEKIDINATFSSFVQEEPKILSQEEAIKRCTQELQKEISFFR